MDDGGGNGGGSFKVEPESDVVMCSMPIDQCYFEAVLTVLFCSRLFRRITNEMSSIIFKTSVDK